MNIAIELDEAGKVHLASEERVRWLRQNTAIYTSRSTVETGWRCKRRRYLQTMVFGRGITRKAVNFPLITGGMVHEKVAAMLDQHRINPITDSDARNFCSDTSTYKELVTNKGYFQDGEKLPGELEYWYNEQAYLQQALAYAWYKFEYPSLANQYDVWASEKDIALFIPKRNSSNQWICFESKADAILKAKESGEFIGYSLKTAKMWTDRSRESYKTGLQPITEWYALEKYLEWLNESIKHAAKALEEIGQSKAAKAVEAKMVTGHVGGIRLCVLRKGAPSDWDDGKISNGLIRPFRQITPTGEDWAIEYRYPNPENKSGYSTLGRGWDRVNIWDIEGFSVFDFIDSIVRGEVQPELGVPLSNYVFVIPEFGIDSKAKEEIIYELINSESAWAERKRLLNAKPPGIIGSNEALALIGQRRIACHFPTPCEYKDVCFDESIAVDPLTNCDLYEVREGHHELESEEI